MGDTTRHKIHRCRSSSHAAREAQGRVGAVALLVRVGTSGLVSADQLCGVWKVYWAARKRMAK